MYKQNWCSTSQQKLKFLKVLAEIAAISRSKCPMKQNQCMPHKTQYIVISVETSTGWNFWTSATECHQWQPPFCNNSACKIGKTNYPEKYSIVNKIKLHKHKCTIVKKKKKKQSQPNAALSPGISGINNQDLSILCATCYLYVRQKLTAVNGRPTFYVKYLHTPKLNKINTLLFDPKGGDWPAIIWTQSQQQRIIFKKMPSHWVLFSATK